MLKSTLIFLAALLLFNCATAEHSIITIGTFTLQADKTWHIDANTAYQLNVYSQSHAISCNIQFYEYDNFSQSHDELIATGIKNDFAIAEMIIDSIDSSGNIFDNMTKEYYSYNCGISAIYYYGNLTEKSDGRYYSGTIMVNSDCILSILTISHTENTGLEDICTFNDSIIASLYYNGNAIASQFSTDDTLDIVPSLQHPSDDIACTGNMTFITPDGWTLISCNDIQVVFSVGDASIYLNAYALDTLYPMMDKMDSDELTECLISIIDSAMIHIGIDTSEFDYIPASLTNGNPIVFFEGWAGEVMKCQYLTSAIFYTPTGVTGLVTILTPEYVPKESSKLLIQSVNMYYPANVLDESTLHNPSTVSALYLNHVIEIASQTPNGTPSLSEDGGDSNNDFSDATITGINSPIAMVISESGTSMDSEESTALTAAIYYTSSDSYTYNSLVQLLVDEGFSYTAAVFAADNCGADWIIE